MWTTNRSTSTSAGTGGVNAQSTAGTLTKPKGRWALGGACPDKQELQERLIEILHRISGADPAVITPDARLMEDVGIDSLGFYEILIEADTCFGIRIKEEELLRFRTVSDILDHLETLELRPPHAETA